MRNKKWKEFLNDKKSTGLYQKIKTRGKHNLKHTEVKTAAELGVVERSSEPESRGAECHIWPWRKQQVSVGRTEEDSCICMQVKSRIMSTEMKEAGHYSR